MCQTRGFNTQHWRKRLGGWGGKEDEGKVLQPALVVCLALCYFLSPLTKKVALSSPHLSAISLTPASLESLWFLTKPFQGPGFTQAKHFCFQPPASVVTTWNYKANFPVSTLLTSATLQSQVRMYWVPICTSHLPHFQNPRTVPSSSWQGFPSMPIPFQCTYC